MTIHFILNPMVSYEKLFLFYLDRLRVKATLIMKISGLLVHHLRTKQVKFRTVFAKLTSDHFYLNFYHMIWLWFILKDKKKIKTTEDDYNKALASDDPTKITPEDLEKLAKDAMKKFKSLWALDGWISKIKKTKKINLTWWS